MVELDLGNLTPEQALKILDGVLQPNRQLNRETLVASHFALQALRDALEDTSEKKSDKKKNKSE